MESQLSYIFQVKVMTKNIVFGSLLLHLSVFLVKQYTSFIYVEKMSFCLLNLEFPFVSSQGPISCRNVMQKYLMHMRIKYSAKWFVRKFLLALQETHSNLSHKNLSATCQNISKHSTRPAVKEYLLTLQETNTYSSHKNHKATWQTIFTHFAK